MYSVLYFRLIKPFMSTPRGKNFIFNNITSWDWCGVSLSFIRNYFGLLTPSQSLSLSRKFQTIAKSKIPLPKYLKWPCPKYLKWPLVFRTKHYETPCFSSMVRCRHSIRTYIRNLLYFILNTKATTCSLHRKNKSEHWILLQLMI